MGLNVYGHVITPATQRVLACLSEKELEFELVQLNMAAGEHNKEPFLSLNPFGVVPAMEDGDLTLFDSRAIVKYIEQAYKDKKPLASDDPKKMGPVYSWLEAESLQFDPAAIMLTFHLCIAPMMGLPTDEAVVEEKEAKLGKVLDVYEDRLSESKYLGGDSFTMVDLFHLPNVNYLMGTKVRALFEARPHVKAWVDDILARPSWAKVVAMIKSQS
ncbi:OLC1v1004269C1 [Oldenlandia corymbosa var. corymbosa]|uniref:glutathione transferase n=1 Tax=Oldenlandia corymbosa var. corymbosa TaxID=529605 RepID=A0AAV1DD50_OLDCO|nr:OLC1v1004269C1 [Oldenlandia corymbosa var. corymbosa]